MTRYGKTRWVAIAILIYITLTPEQPHPKPKRIVIIAPTVKQTQILRGYISEMVATSSYLSSLLEKPTGSAEKLRAELSKERITFRNGWEIITLTANADENEAEPAKNLMGFGGDIIIIDEACLILQKVYTQRISRMLGDNAGDSKLIVIVNPWHKLNFAYSMWQSSEFTKLHIDWRQALVEGRTTQKYLDEQRTLLSDYEWEVLYESNFADQAEDSLLRYDWIQRAINKQVQFTGQTRQIWGLDVAEKGADHTVLTCAQTDGTQYQVTKQSWIRAQETIPCARSVSAIVPKTETIQVDSIGVGAGVYSALKEMGHDAVSIRVSEAPTSDTGRYLNKKSQRWWYLRNLFEKDLISIPNDQTLISQLSKMKYEITTAGKIRIIDPPDKSPDYADSLMLTVFEQPKAWAGYIDW